MNAKQFDMLLKLIAQIADKPKAAKNAPKPSSYKPANKFTPKRQDGMTDRQIRNDAAVARAFKKAGFTVIPRVDALTYKGWLAKGLRVNKGEKGTWVKGVGTLFHSGQVSPDAQMSKSEMTAEVAQMSFPA